MCLHSLHFGRVHVLGVRSQSGAEKFHSALVVLLIGPRHAALNNPLDHRNPEQAPTKRDQDQGICRVDIARRMAGPAARQGPYKSHPELWTETREI